MKVILLKEVKGLGNVGDIKEVAEGYAQNFLIPSKQAEIATKHGMKVNQDMARKKVRQVKRDLSKKQALAGKIDKKSFIIEAKTDEKGTLYAKFSRKKLAEIIKKNGFNVSPKDIKTKEVIKQIGEYKVDLNLVGKSATITIVVKKQV